jgi:hypothetical protein
MEREIPQGMLVKNFMITLMKFIGNFINQKLLRGKLKTVGANSPKISYSAVVLDKVSQRKLLDFLLTYYPHIYAESDWEKLAHHMTITMGELPPELKSDIDKRVGLRTTYLGSSNNVLAVKVSGYPSKNKHPHITLAVNRKLGGKPVMSNNINNWQKLRIALNLKGIVTEIPFDNKPKL